ncbi:hypothetical protein Q7P35_010208 [Cladosporium inversicolor]
MTGYESDEEEQSTERSPRLHYADRRNVPVSSHHQQRTPASRPQVHQQMPPQLQPLQSQRSPPPQDRNHAAHVTQHPVNRFSDRPGGQQYHEDTYGRPFPSEEAQLWCESRHGRLPGFTSNHDPFQNMRLGASQYPTTFTTRAISGSEVGGTTPHRTLSSDQTRNTRARPYEDDRMDPELFDINRHSANPLAFSPAGPGDYPYPQMLDLPSAHPGQVYSSYEPSFAYDSRISAHHTPGSSRLYNPQSSLGRAHDQHTNPPVDSQHQQSVQHSYTRSRLYAATGFPSSRCQYGCSTPPGYDCGHKREQR